MPRPPRPWFRFYSEALESRKAQRLKPALFKHWVNLLCLANVHTPRGSLPSPADIAFAMRLSESAVIGILEDLMSQALVDCNGAGYVMHDWDEWQKDSDARISDGRHSADEARRYVGGKWVVAPQNGGDNAAIAPQFRGDRVEESRGDKEEDKDKEKTRPDFRARYAAMGGGVQ